MEMLNYELGQARIAELKAFKNPPQAAWHRAGLWESLGGWRQLLPVRRASRKVSPAYRAELLRQEWMVPGEPLNKAKC